MLSHYLRSQNRPYSVIQLFDNLHGRVNKALLEGALSELCAGGTVCSKTYGKAVVYWPSQAGFAEVGADEVARLNAQKEDLEARVAAAAGARRAAEARLAALTAGPSGEALEAALEEEGRAVAALEARMAGIRAAMAGGGGGGGGGGASSSSSSAAEPAARAPLSAKDRAALKASVSRYRKVWAARKGQCVDFVGHMADGMGVKPAKVFADLGIEGDEEAGVNIKDFPV